MSSLMSSCAGLFHPQLATSDRHGFQYARCPRRMDVVTRKRGVLKTCPLINNNNKKKIHQLSITRHLFQLLLKKKKTCLVDSSLLKYLWCWSYLIERILKVTVHFSGQEGHRHLDFGKISCYWRFSPKIWNTAYKNVEYYKPRSRQ